jgi:hypothetical protein
MDQFVPVEHDAFGTVLVAGDDVNGRRSRA